MTLPLRLVALGKSSPRAASCNVCGAGLYPYLSRCPSCGVIISRPDSNAPRAMRIGHLTDLHLVGGARTSQPAAATRSWLEAFKAAQVDVCLISGDLVEKPGDGSAIGLVKQLADEADLPGGILVAPGNHDVPKSGGSGFIDTHFGPWPRIEHRGSVDIALVDSTRGLDARPWKERGMFWVKVMTEGGIADHHLETLGTQWRAEAKARVLVVHHHLKAQSAEALEDWLPVPDDTGGTMRPMANADAVLRWCRRHNVGLVLHGHKHRRSAWRAADTGLLIANPGSSTKARSGRYRAFVFDVLEDGSVLPYSAEIHE